MHTATSRTGETMVDPMIEAVLHASRALVAVAARSLAAAEDEITLPQYRVLVVLNGHGSLPATELASMLAVHPSTLTRMASRLVAKALVSREETEGDRRQVRLKLTLRGGDLVRGVTDRRRSEITRIVGAIPADRRGQVVEALDAFATAAGELSDLDWTAGWAL